VIRQPHRSRFTLARPGKWKRLLLTIRAKPAGRQIASLHSNRRSQNFARASDHSKTSWLSSRADPGSIAPANILYCMTWLLWALLSALFAAATAILAKIGVAGIDSNLATAIRTTVVLVFTWAIAIALGRHTSIAVIGSRSWLFLVLSGIATGLSWLCYFRALQLGPASAVAPIDKLSVVLVILFAWIFLGEGLSVHKIVGGLLIAGGAATLVFG
jgi:bacterial/archaeal transporter family protein